jgi:hypothetical protein
VALGLLSGSVEEGGLADAGFTGDYGEGGFTVLCCA